MPSMYQIYDKHAIEYDKLVNHEDYQGNLKAALHQLYPFQNSKVIEFGTGTGRVTKLLIEAVQTMSCHDRSAHMLALAEENLAQYAAKLSFTVLDNLQAHTIADKADVVIEGWSFGHTVSDDPAKIDATIDQLVTSCENLVKAGGKVILIETLGTNVDQPAAPTEALGQFYQALESQYGYTKTVVATDYQFPSLAEAKTVMGFFFGPAIIPTLEQGTASIIPEFTGIWHKTISPKTD